MTEGLYSMADFLATYGEKAPLWIPQIWAATKVTLAITTGSFVLGVLAGALVAMMVMSRNAVARNFALVYIEVTRGVPVLVILFLVYYGLVPMGIVMDAVPTAIISIGLCAAGYIAEIFRGAIQSIHRGQREAALAVGLTPFNIYRHIIFPQALRVAIPPLMNMLVALLKDSSLASLISAPELMLRAKDIASQDFLPLHVAMLVGVVYLALSIPLSALSAKIERRLNVGRKGAAASSTAGSSLSAHRRGPRLHHDSRRAQLVSRRTELIDRD